MNIQQWDMDKQSNLLLSMDQKNVWIKMKLYISLNNLIHF